MIALHLCHPNSACLQTYFLILLLLCLTPLCYAVLCHAMPCQRYGVHRGLDGDNQLGSETDDHKQPQGGLHAAAAGAAANSGPGRPRTTPIYILAEAAGGSGGGGLYGTTGVGGFADDDEDVKRFRSTQAGGRAVLPWSSPTLRSSPADQLIAAILDGDVQGITNRRNSHFVLHFTASCVID